MSRHRTEHYAGVCGVCGQSIGGDRTFVGKHFTGKSNLLVRAWLWAHRWGLLCPGWDPFGDNR